MEAKGCQTMGAWKSLSDVMSCKASEENEKSEMTEDVGPGPVRMCRNYKREM